MDWKKKTYYYHKHHERFKKFVTSRKNLLFCLECRGDGGWREIIEPELGGPWYDCGWCEGTVYMSPHLRGLWLRFKKEEKRAKAK